MNPGDEVETLIGKGIILEKKGKKYKIKLYQLPKANYYRSMHIEKGGLWFSELGLKLVKSNQPKRQQQQMELHW